MSPLANYRAFLSSFHYIPPQESFVKRINYSDKNMAAREIWRLGQNPLEMDVRTFGRIKIACSRLSVVGDGAKIPWVPEVFLARFLVSFMSLL